MQSVATKFLFPLLLYLSLFSGDVVAEGFVFAGLGLGTTDGELKARYPRSSMVGNYMYLSEADSHDHIYGIEIPGTGPEGRLRLSFERPREQSGARGPRYPSCQHVLSVIQARYGSPARVMEFAEEGSWNRSLVWIKAGETLSLHCFRLGRDAFFAEALTITALPR